MIDELKALRYSFLLYAHEFNSLIIGMVAIIYVSSHDVYEAGAYLYHLECSARTLG